eukprot:g23984.t1
MPKSEGSKPAAAEPLPYVSPDSLRGRDQVLYRFLRGEDRDDVQGRTLDKILLWRDDQLEAVHDYVQWIFPTDEASMMCRHLLYLWGEVDFCPCPDLLERPTPCFRLPRMAKKLCLGGSFGLVLDVAGEVFAWGDDTYGELGGATMDFGGWPLANRSFTDPQTLPVPGKITLPRHAQEKDAIWPGSAESWNQWDLGTSMVAPCHGQDLFPSRRHLHQTRAQAWNAERRFLPATFCCSLRVTVDHRLWIWGHPSNRKLGHVGFNHDGTEAGEDPGIGAKKSKARPPGVAVRSALRDAVRRPHMVFALLHRRVRTLGLGDECTVIVHGDGKSLEEEPAPYGASLEVSSPVGFTTPTNVDASSDLEAALPHHKAPRPSLVVSCAGALQHLRHRVTFMTGGMNGVQKAFSQNCVGGNLFELLPIGSYGEIAHAHDLHAGADRLQWTSILEYTERIQFYDDRCELKHSIQNFDE